MSTALGKVCNACGIERKKRGVLYDPTDFMPYCENPYICNQKHPNSPNNLIDRGEELKMIPIDEAKDRFKKYLALKHPDKDTADRIRKMVENPITLRIGNPELAEFILELKKEFGLSSVSDTLRYCVEQVKVSHNTFYQDYKEMQEEKEEQEEEQRTEQEIQSSLEEKPSPVSNEETKEEEEEEEEELTF